MCVCRRRLARLAQDIRHRADAAEQAEPEAAGADPHHVAARDAAVAQSTLGCHSGPPLRGRAGISTRIRTERFDAADTRRSGAVRQAKDTAAGGRAQRLCRGSVYSRQAVDL